MPEEVEEVVEQPIFFFGVRVGIGIAEFFVH
jgi:hypothetical protein